MERYEKYQTVEQNKKRIMVNNFLGGISWGIGITLGATIVIGVIVILLQQLSWVPIVGDTFLEISQYIQENAPNVPKP